MVRVNWGDFDPAEVSEREKGMRSFDPLVSSQLSPNQHVTLEDQKAN
jgi:hypothetical protein